MRVKSTISALALAALVACTSGETNQLPGPRVTDAQSDLREHVAGLTSFQPAEGAFAGAAILCVGPGDHRAVESQHATDVGCSSESQEPLSRQAAAGFSTGDPLTSDCTDSPLHSEAELVSSHSNGVGTPVAIAIVPTDLRPPVDRGSLVRPRARAPDATAAYRAVRTTVLII